MKRMSAALRERLGEETARELEAYAEGLGHDWRDQVMESAAERFDTRLAAVSERFDNRLDAVSDRFDTRLAAVSESFDSKLAAVSERFDARLATATSELRVEMHQGFARIWQAVADLRVSIADNRVELLRWSFLFWIGQVVAVAGLLAFMLRGVLPR